jgi:hypothetical protein
MSDGSVSYFEFTTSFRHKSVFSEIVDSYGGHAVIFDLTELTIP